MRKKTLKEWANIFGMPIAVDQMEAGKGVRVGGAW